MIDPPKSLAAIKLIYGDITVRNGQVVAPPKWESQNMVPVRDFPLLVRPLYVHRLIVEPLRLALAGCQALNDGYMIRTIGCFAPRQKRTDPSAMSLHSWGIAVDINASTNPLILHCPTGDPRRQFGSGAFDLPEAWVKVWKAIGWMWGGDFSRSFDAMHFQFASGA